uniref:Uncharacterized protein n=1 Tax=Ascaris lumbricoides TaxID=6252 RepID=A0A0M3I3A9_ASCLU
MGSSVYILRLTMFGFLGQKEVGYTSAWRVDEKKMVVVEDLANLARPGGDPRKDLLNSRCTGNQMIQSCRRMPQVCELIMAKQKVFAKNSR